MFWKFVVGILVLPSCLGFEIAAASMPSEKLAAPVQQTHVDKNYREYASIPGDHRADSGTLLQTKYDRDYEISHRDYHHRDCSHNRYYSHEVYHPQYVDYYRRDRYGNGYHHPRYDNYYQRDRYGNGYHHPRNNHYYQRDRYGDGYHHPRYDNYYQRDRYEDRHHHHNGYYYR